MPTISNIHSQKNYKFITLVPEGASTEFKQLKGKVYHSISMTDSLQPKNQKYKSNTVIHHKND